MAPLHVCRRNKSLRSVLLTVSQQITSNPLYLLFWFIKTDSCPPKCSKKPFPSAHLGLSGQMATWGEGREGSYLYVGQVVWVTYGHHFIFYPHEGNLNGTQNKNCGGKKHTFRRLVSHRMLVYIYTSIELMSTQWCEGSGYNKVDLTTDFSHVTNTSDTHTSLYALVGVSLHHRGRLYYYRF